MGFVKREAASAGECEKAFDLAKPTPNGEIDTPAAEAAVSAAVAVGAV